MEMKDCFANIENCRDAGCYALHPAYDFRTNRECKWCEICECKFYKPKSEVTIDQIKSELRSAKGDNL